MRARSLTSLLALALVLSAACSFFDPRVPADPDPGSDIPWLQPFSPTTVVINLVNAMEGRGLIECMNCCDISYMFIPDPSDSAEFGGSYNFANWDFAVEQNTLGNIFAAVEGSGYPDDSLVSVIMNAVPGYPDPAGPDSIADIWRDYEIVLAGSADGGWDRPAMGRVRFTMVQDEVGLWRISVWEDIRPEGYTGQNFTWGRVKVTYR